MKISRNFKRLLALAISFVFAVPAPPAVYGAEYSWKVLNASSGDNGFGCISVCGPSSVNENDSTIKYSGNDVLRNTTLKLDSQDGIMAENLLPNADIGEAYKISAKIYAGTLIDGNYKKDGKLRIGISDDEKSYCSTAVVTPGKWCDIEYTYTVTDKNRGCGKILIDRGGKDGNLIYPRWFLVAEITVRKAVTGDDNSDVQNNGEWTRFAFDGFENTIANAAVSKASTGMRLWHKGNALTKTYGDTTPYEGYSCLYNFASNAKLGYAFSNLLPTFTKDDIGRRVKISIYMLASHLKYGNGKIKFQFGICDTDEKEFDTNTVYADNAAWTELKTELEITEENLNYTKIMLSLDNDDNFPMFMRVDSLSVDVTKDAEGAKEINLAVDGKSIETKNKLIIENDRLMLPAEDLFAALGAGYSLSDNGQSIKATFGGKTAEMAANSDVIDADGQKLHDSSKPKMIDGVLYIPNTALNTAYKASTKWDGKSCKYDVSTEFPIIRRNVPTSTLTTDSDPYNVYVEDYEMKEVVPWDEISGGETVLTEEDLFRSKNREGGEKFGTQKIVDVEGMPFDKAWRCDCTVKPGSEYEFQLMLPQFKGKYKPKDILVIEFTYRTISSKHEDGQGQLGVGVEMNGPPHTKIVTENFSTNGEWTTVRIPFEEKEDDKQNGTSYTQICLRMGSRVQCLEVGGFTLKNYKNKYQLEQFDMEGDNANVLQEIYGKDEQWRREAIGRIEQIRKGDINVLVLDRNGKPVKDADVEISMFEHEFEWGTAITDFIVANQSTDPNVNNEAKIISSLFNSAVCEAANKWGNYKNSRFLARQLGDCLKDLGVRHIRGHCAFTDQTGGAGFGNEINSIKYDYEAVKKVIANRLDLMFSDYGDYKDWDVINEALDRHELFDLYGYDLYKWIIEYAKEKLPKGSKVQFNETRGGDGVYLYAKELLAAGVPINHMGFESHLAFGVKHTYYETLFEKMEELNIPIKVTEFDVNCDNQEWLAGQVRDYMLTAFSSPMVDGFYMWGFADTSHWFSNAPIMKNTRSMDSIKPSGKMFIDLVYNKWWTRESGTTDADGTYKCRGFYGDYDIKVTKGGATVSTVASVSKNNKDNTVIVRFK